MHIPDGMVSVPTALSTWAISGVFVAIGLRKGSRRLEERQVPLLGVTAAFIFAAQMVNFPVYAGTSGHFLGATLASVLLGPWNGLIVMSLVVTIQCLVAGDGGLSALGANILNMGIIGCFAGFGINLFLQKLLPKSKKSLFISVAAASWGSVVLAAIACGLEISPLGHFRLPPVHIGRMSIDVVIGAMAATHALVGIGEAIITCSVLGMVLAVRPDLLPFWKRIARAEVVH